MIGEEPVDAGNTISGGIFYGPVLQGRDVQATFQLAAAAPVALAQLPAPTTGFAGRVGELGVLAELLDPGGTAEPVVVSAVAGLAGVGKTTLALQAGRAAVRRGWFSGGVLFLDLHGYDDQPVEPGPALDALLRALGVAAEHIPPGIEERAGLYRSVLAQIADPVLVVADNASSEAQVRPLLPGTGPHKVLVTSRHTLAGLGARLVDVTVLDVPASIALLDRALRAARPDDDRISGDREAAGRLAGICGGLPLALQITAALLNADPAHSAAGLAEELAAESQRLERLRYDDGSGTDSSSVAAAFDLSYRRLDETAARVFRLLPVHPGPDFSTAAAAVLAELPLSQVREVLAGLARAHLAEAAPGAERWRMHDLVRLYARRLSPPLRSRRRRLRWRRDDQEQAWERLLGYYLRMADAADDHLRALPGTVVPAEFTGRDDALAWLDTERANLVTAVSAAADTGHDQAALHLPLLLALYFDWRRWFDDWLLTTAISLNTARRLGDRRREGLAQSSLGVALRQMRRFEEAITAHQDAAAIYRHTGDRHSEGGALTNLGNALRDVGRFEEAITACQDAAAIYRDTGDRHGEGGALTNLGNALQGVGRSEEAITALQDAAAIYRDTGDRKGEGDALNSLGLALRQLGRSDEAITACQDAAAIYRETGDRHGEGLALTNVGLALQEVGRFEEAISACQDAAAAFRQTGDRHGEGGALTNLGLALQEVGRFEEAITAHQDATAIYRDTGDRHSEGGALNSLGTALQEVGRSDEAITAHQDATAIYRDTGDRHSEGGALNNLGNALQEVRRSDEAITALQDATAIYRDTGDRHSEGIALNNLGNALAEVRRFEEAITACQDAAAIYQETGDRHSEGQALTNLGNALAEVRRSDEAIAALQDAAAIFRDTGDRHSEGIALYNLGNALQEVRRFEEAITACQDAAAIYQETGDRHSEGQALTNLGNALAEVRRFDEAITALQDAAAIFRDTGDQNNERIALDDLEAARSAQEA